MIKPACRLSRILRIQPVSASTAACPEECAYHSTIICASHLVGDHAQGYESRSTHQDTKDEGVVEPVTQIHVCLEGCYPVQTETHMKQCSRSSGRTVIRTKSPQHAQGRRHRACRRERCAHQQRDPWGEQVGSVFARAARVYAARRSGATGGERGGHGAAGGGPGRLRGYLYRPLHVVGNRVPQQTLD